MKGYQNNNNISHMNLNNLLPSHNSKEILQQFSQQMLTLEKSRSENGPADEEDDEKLVGNELALTKSMSNKPGSKKDHNFKVIVRVRPPLSKEIDPISGFTPITQISKNNK